MNATIGVIYNPFGGSNRKHPNRKKKLEKILDGHGLLRETKSVEDIQAVAEEFYDKDIQILAISGGDGSNHFVFTNFIEVYGKKELPLIAFLRGGTMNLLESSLGMKGSPETRLKKLLRIVQQDRYPIVFHTLLCVNNKYGYIFGNGAVANFLKEYYNRNRQNFFQALGIFARAVWTGITGERFARELLAPIQAQIHIMNQTLPSHNFSILMAATEKGCGLGFQPFYRAREIQGKFHFLALHNLNPMEVVRNLTKVYNGKKLSSSFLYEEVTDSVQIETFEPYYYTIDGELFNSTKSIHLSAGPVVKVIAL